MDVDEALSAFKDSSKDPHARGLALARITLLGKSEDLFDDLVLAAIPRFFDQDILAILDPGRQESKVIFAELVSLSVVSKVRGRDAYAVHESVRLPLRLDLCNTEPEKFRNANRLMVDYYARRPGIRAAIERVYHQLASAPKAGVASSRELMKVFRTLGDREGAHSLGNALRELIGLPCLSDAAEGVCLLSAARASLDVRIDDEGADLCRRAYHAFTKCEDIAGIIESLVLLAKVLADTSNHETARQHASLAAEVAQQALKSTENADTLRLAAVAENAYGNILGELGDIEESCVHHKRDVLYSERALKAAPEDLEVLRAAAVAHQNYGLALRLAKRDEAKIHFQKEREFTERILKLVPYNFQARYDMAVTLGNEASGVENEGDKNSAIQLYNKSIDLLRSLLTESPLNPRVKMSIVINLQSLGSLWTEQDRGNEAEMVLHESLQYADELQLSDPKNSTWMRNLSVSHNRLGELFEKRGMLAKALSHYEKDLHLAEELLSQSPQNPIYINDCNESRECVSRVRNRLEL